MSDGRPSPVECCEFVSRQVRLTHPAYADRIDELIAEHRALSAHPNLSTPEAAELTREDVESLRFRHEGNYGRSYLEAPTVVSLCDMALLSIGLQKQLSLAWKRIAKLEGQNRIQSEFLGSRQCPDHNGKWERGRCLQCELERAEAALAKARSERDEQSRRASLALDCVAECFSRDDFRRFSDAYAVALAKLRSGEAG